MKCPICKNDFYGNLRKQGVVYRKRKFPELKGDIWLCYRCYSYHLAQESVIEQIIDLDPAEIYDSPVYEEKVQGDDSMKRTLKFAGETVLGAFLGVILLLSLMGILPWLYYMVFLMAMAEPGPGSALMGAARRGHIDTVQALIAKGADVHAKNKDGKTALMYVKEKDHAYIVQLLKQAGAKEIPPPYAWDLNADLLKAVKEGQTEAVKALIAQGADVNAKDLRGMTALMWAALGGHTEAVKALLEAGADVNAKGSFGIGMTALMWAARMGHIDTVQALIAKGADVNAKRKDGKSALMWAAYSGHADIVQLLKQAGAKE